MNPATLPTSAAGARELAGTWLGHLPTDRRGLPVPYVNRWGPETARATRVSWDPHARRPAIFQDDVDGGDPDFTRQHMGRAREAVLTGLCQVCGRPVPWPRRQVVLSGVSTETVWIADLQRDVVVVNEPWLDARCAAIATLMCPALIRRDHNDDLYVVPVPREQDARLVMSVGTVDLDKLAGLDDVHPDHLTRLRAALARGPVTMWAKILLLNHYVARADC